MDGYQECYRISFLMVADKDCPIARMVIVVVSNLDPSLSKAYHIPTYKVIEKNNYCRHWAANVTEEPTAKSSTSWFFGTDTKSKKSEVYAGSTDGLWLYCYPNVGINCYEPAWYSMKVVPLEKNKTRLEYEIQEFITFLKQLEKEVCPLRRD
jgi:hypothetical protein